MNTYPPGIFPEDDELITKPIPVEPPQPSPLTKEEFEQLENLIQEHTEQMPEDTKELIAFIDKKYMEARLNKVSRFDLNWGIWSAVMNRWIRMQIEQNCENSLALKYVTLYWSVRSQLLELFVNHKVQYMLKAKNMEKDCNEIRKMIITGNLRNIFE